MQSFYRLVGVSDGISQLFQKIVKEMPKSRSSQNIILKQLVSKD
jgi:hypothetical protein